MLVCGFDSMNSRIDVNGNQYSYTACCSSIFCLFFNTLCLSANITIHFELSCIISSLNYIAFFVTTIYEFYLRHDTIWHYIAADKCLCIGIHGDLSLFVLLDWNTVFDDVFLLSKSEYENLFFLFLSFVLFLSLWLWQGCDISFILFIS